MKIRIKNVDSFGKAVLTLLGANIMMRVNIHFKQKHNNKILTYDEYINLQRNAVNETIRDLRKTFIKEETDKK